MAARLAAPLIAVQIVALLSVLFLKIAPEGSELDSTQHHATIVRFCPALLPRYPRYQKKDVFPTSDTLRRRGTFPSPRFSAIPAVV